MAFTPRSGWGASRSYKSAGHYAVARGSRADYMSTSGAVVHIDTREIQKVGYALRDAGVGYERSKVIQAQNLNRAGQRLGTQLKRFLKLWTGIRRFQEVTKRMHPIVATAGNLSAGVRVSGRHFRITKADFGASWRRSWPGGKHSAWNRSQTAKGSFMPARFSGGASYGGGLLFTRTTSKRFPIKPLWGPNPVREMEKRQPMVRALVTKEARWFLRECTRRAEVELKKAKAKYGL